MKIDQPDEFRNLNEESSANQMFYLPKEDKKTQAVETAAMQMTQTLLAQP